MFCTQCKSGLIASNDALSIQEFDGRDQRVDNELDSDSSCHVLFWSGDEPRRCVIKQVITNLCPSCCNLCNNPL